MRKNSSFERDLLPEAGLAERGKKRGGGQFFFFKSHNEIKDSNKIKLKAAFFVCEVPTKNSFFFYFFY